MFLTNRFIKFVNQHGVLKRGGSRTAATCNIQDGALCDNS